MPDPQTPDRDDQSLLQASRELVAVALETPFREMTDLPQRVGQVLGDPRVRAAIEEAFRQRALSLLDQQLTLQSHWGNDPQAAQARQARDETLDDLGDATLGALRDSALRQITAGSSVARLRREARDFREAFNRSPVGVWIDRNSGIVYTVGVVGAIGAAAGLWWTRSDLAGRPLELVDVTVPIGSVEIQGAVTDFRPGSRRAGGRLGITADFQQLQLGLSLAGKHDAGTGQTSGEGRLSLRRRGLGSLALAGRLTLDRGQNLDATRPGTIGLVPGEAQSTARVRYDLGLETSLDLSGMNINLFAYLGQTDLYTRYLGQASVLSPGLGSINGALDGLNGGLAVRLRRNRRSPLNLDVGGFFDTNGTDMRGGLQLRLRLP